VTSLFRSKALYKYPVYFAFAVLPTVVTVVEAVVMRRQVY